MGGKKIQRKRKEKWGCIKETPPCSVSLVRTNSKKKTPHLDLEGRVNGKKGGKTREFKRRRKEAGRWESSSSPICKNGGKSWKDSKGGSRSNLDNKKGERGKILRIE